jgi:hypothetical protein
MNKESVPKTPEPDFIRLQLIENQGILFILDIKDLLGT